MDGWLGRTLLPLQKHVTLRSVGRPGHYPSWRPSAQPAPLLTSALPRGPAGVKDGDMRLAGGEADNEGRVEIFYSGQWGTVCDSLWDLTDASVVCRALGFRNVTKALGGAAFGPGRLRVPGSFTAGTRCQAARPRKGWYVPKAHKMAFLPAQPWRRFQIGCSPTAVELGGSGLMLDQGRSLQPRGSTPGNLPSQNSFPQKKSLCAAAVTLKGDSSNIQ